jgi:hypothetical protein
LSNYPLGIGAFVWLTAYAPEAERVDEIKLDSSIGTETYAKEALT